MDNIEQIRRSIQTHADKTDSMEEGLAEKLRALDASILAMQEAGRNTASIELAELDRQARLLVAEFEVEHPAVARLLEQLAAILQKMGI